MSLDNFNKYKEEVLNECKNLGATEKDLLPITDEVIETGMKNGRPPKDLAWALLQ